MRRLQSRERTLNNPAQFVTQAGQALAGAAPVQYQNFAFDSRHGIFRAKRTKNFGSRAQPLNGEVVPLATATVARRSMRLTCNASLIV